MTFEAPTRPFRRLLLAALLVLAAAGPATSREAQFVSRSETASLAGLEAAFARVAERAGPGVVAVTVGTADAPANFDPRHITPTSLDRLLAGGGRSVGTGFCVDARGIVVTNHHVIEGARQIYVTTDDGRVLPAMLVAADPRGDLAVLKVPGTLTPLAFSPSPARRGQWAVAVGNPVGLGGGGGMSVSAGLVSATARALPRLSREQGRHYSNLLQTTAELNPGNSGGPLLDLEGRVIGIVTAVVLPQSQTHGVGFAIAADADVRARIAGMSRGERPTYGYLGVAGTAAPGEAGVGMLVTRVGVGTPADGRLRAGDVILALGDRPVHDETAFIRLISASTPREPVSLRVRRGGEHVAVTVRLEARPGQGAAGRDEQRLRHRGVTFAHHPQGGCVVVATDPTSRFARDWPVGSVARTINGRPTHDLAALFDAFYGG